MKISHEWTRIAARRLKPTVNQVFSLRENREGQYSPFQMSCKDIPLLTVEFILRLCGLRLVSSSPPKKGGAGGGVYLYKKINY